jgi:hypothetical protein
MQHLEGSGMPVLCTGRAVLNLLNAKLNSSCKSQLAEFFCVGI